MATEKQPAPTRWWTRVKISPSGPKKSTQDNSTSSAPSIDSEPSFTKKPAKWSLGILNDAETDEVPGSVLLMSRVANRNEPLGLQHIARRTSSSTLPSPFLDESEGSVPRQLEVRSPVMSDESMFSDSEVEVAVEAKRTLNGTIILDPQPSDSMNDPLNWPALRRDLALISLGFFSMIGGGMTPVLAAGYQNVAQTYGVPVAQVSLTTGLYMTGLGLGSVFASPTAILYGKRPVYLAGAILLIISSIWCAASPNYPSLLVARIVQGFAVSPVECLPSASIAEIFFLHERAYRLGIYTLLLLGGKNLIPLVSAAIIQGLSWQWVFWIVAIVVGFAFVLLFLFVPETFWDRTPRAKKHHHKHAKHDEHDGPKSARSIGRSLRGLLTPGLPHPGHLRTVASMHTSDFKDLPAEKQIIIPGSETQTAQMDEPVSRFDKSNLAQRRANKKKVGFAADVVDTEAARPSEDVNEHEDVQSETTGTEATSSTLQIPEIVVSDSESLNDKTRATPRPDLPKTPMLHNLNSPYYQTLSPVAMTASPDTKHPTHPSPASAPHTGRTNYTSTTTKSYTTRLRTAPPKSYLESLKPWNGRLTRDKWIKCAVRPFILFAYPSILWSTLVYSLSVGWLIVLSESVAIIYRDRATYNFTALQAGLVYISPFIGGILGTAVAGKVSDIIVRALARRNQGVYEPEFRLFMAIPVLLATVTGLIGFGWSADIHDAWIVPTVFFGIISFGCSLGSTTAITFAVDSYRQYAGEALVTMNFSKNILHGLVFSLFFPEWLESWGPTSVFSVIGGVQCACLLATVPMYIYGKRARMWTVRKGMMERF